jgi:hypothetical protein
MTAAGKRISQYSVGATERGYLLRTNAGFTGLRLGADTGVPTPDVFYPPTSGFAHK